MNWLFLALLSRVFLATCNVFDSHFQNAHFKDGFAQNFFGSIYFIVIIPLLYLWIHPALPPVSVWPWLIAAGCMFRLFLIPYFEAMNHADSSAVSSMFMLGRVFAPVFAYFLIGEVLTAREWLGFGVVVAGALLLTNTPGKMHFNLRPMLLMAAAGMMIALYTVTSKHCFNVMPWLDAYFYTVLIGNLLAWSMILAPPLRAGIVAGARQFPKIGAHVGISVLLALTGNFMYFYALSLTKVSNMVMIAQFQPFMVILIGWIFSKLGWLKLTRESFAVRDIRRKVIAFLVMIAGVALALAPRF